MKINKFYVDVHTKELVLLTNVTEYFLCPGITFLAPFEGLVFRISRDVKGKIEAWWMENIENRSLSELSEQDNDLFSHSFSIAFDNIRRTAKVRDRNFVQ